MAAAADLTVEEAKDPNPSRGERLHADEAGELNASFDRSVEEGAGRLNRPIGNLLASALPG